MKVLGDQGDRVVEKHRGRCSLQGRADGRRSYYRFDHPEGKGHGIKEAVMRVRNLGSKLPAIIGKDGGRRGPAG